MIGYFDFKGNNTCILYDSTQIDYASNTYYALFNGKLYNKNNLKNLLLKNDFKLYSDDDEEIIVKLFIMYGYDIVDYLDGVFSIAILDTKKEELFLARDHLGVKPLYYYMENHVLYFSTSIHKMFKEFDVQPILNEQSVGEIFGVGPAHTPGLGVFQDIFELKPAHYAVFNKNRHSF